MLPTTESFIQAIVWASVMLTVAGAAAFIIARSAQAALSAMAKEAGKALSHVDAAKARTAGTRPQIVTEGRAVFQIPNGAHLVTLSRDGGNDERGGDAKSLSDLASALSASGLDPRMIVDGRRAEQGRPMSLCYVQLGAGDPPSQIRAAFSAMGFSEEAGAPRRVLTPSDAQGALGRLAFDRAVSNAETLRERLGSDRELEIVSTEMSTETPGDSDGLVTMAARVVWRQRDRVAAPVPDAPTPA